MPTTASHISASMVSRMFGDACIRQYARMVNSATVDESPSVVKSSRCCDSQNATIGVVGTDNGSPMYVIVNAGAVTVPSAVSIAVMTPARLTIAPSRELAP